VPSFLRLVACALIVWSTPSAARAADAHEVDVRTSVDRTAVWVGDRLTYTITLACRKGVDVLADDLSKDKLRLEGLEIVGSDSERSTDRDDATRYAFHYSLTTYRIDVPELKVAPLTVRYYVKRAGQRLEDLAPAGEVVAPPIVIAFRSALPDGQETYLIRDGRAARPRPMRYALLQPIGVGLVLMSIVPAVLGLIAVVRRGRPREPRPSARQTRHDERASLEAVHAIDISTPAGRREAYSRLNTLIRHHLEQAAGIGAAGLTPAEIEAALSARRAHVPVELVTQVLSACDRARFAPPDALPSSEDCRTAIQQTHAVLGDL
jgi:hypothetical protein